MQKTININASTPLVFSRWSRKSFASFCSIGKNVIIAKVKNEIANASLSKNHIDSDSISHVIKNHKDSNDYLKELEVSFCDFTINKNIFISIQFTLAIENTKSQEIKFILQNKHQYSNTISLDIYCDY